MRSAERIHEYGLLPPEEDQGKHNKSLINTSSEWPTHGIVEFRNYSLRHRNGLDSVIGNINLRIDSGEKIGIIDRSNIEGELLIDNIDISRITLNHLRSHLDIPMNILQFS